MLRHAVSDEHLKYIGDITVSFSLLELIIQLFIGSLICDQQRIGRIITAELSFRNLRSLLISLYIERFGEDDDFKILKDLMNKLNKVEERRNQLIHSNWGASHEEFSITRVKTTAKEKHGLKFDFENITISDLKSFAKEIRTLAYDLQKLNHSLIEMGKPFN